MKNFDTRLKVSLASNAQVIQVFQATVSPQPSSLMQSIHMDIACDFMNALVVAEGCSLSNVIACMLQTFLDIAPSCRACQFFFQGLALCFAFIYIISNAQLYGHVVRRYSELLWNYEFVITKITFMENQTFQRKFYATKIWRYIRYILHGLYQ